MAYNAIETSYRQHQTDMAAQTGGESWELPAICTALAEMIQEAVGPLPLDPPLRHAWGYPVQVPNGEWPNFVVIADPDAGSTVRGYNSCMRLWTHHLVGFLICGPANGDPVTLQAVGLPYFDPLDRAIQANQSLDRRVTRIDVGMLAWRNLTYNGNEWFGVYMPLTVEAQSLWTRS